MPQELKPSPRVAGLSALADALMRAKATANRYEVKQWMPLLGGTGVGDLVLGRGPEEINEWSYGNSPLTVPQLSNVPQFKKGRAEQLVDVTNLAPIVGGLGALARRPVMAAGRAGERLAERVIPRVMERGGIPAQLLQDLAQGSQSAVIKQKGGNWLSGSIEDALQGLKRGDYENEAVRNLRRVRPNMTVEEAREFIQAAPVDPRDTAMNAWIDKQLRNYVRNDMATPEDPIRALAERGVSHVEHQPLRTHDIENLPSVRQGLGFEPGGEGVSDLARRWEDIADVAIDEPALAGGHWGEATLQQNPWLRKVPPQTPVQGTYFSSDGLGFDHLIDELRNATNPNSGLPRELLLKYESLPQVSVPQAVERVAKINAWRAAQKAEADLAKATNAATVLHKDYPGKGFKWVELKKQDQLPEGWSEEFVDTDLGKLRKLRDPKTGGLTATDPREEALRDALKYEGDTMGHCVGGYCDEVASGRTKIFSLRDAKGQPHTTIEVKPQGAVFSDVAKHLGKEETERLLDEGVTLSEMIQRIPDFQRPQKIVQIKGKGNRAPNDEYLPYVQDFVKSGQWSDVGDLSNTGLLPYNRGRQAVPQGLTGRTTMGVPFDEVGIPEGYYTNEELLKHVRDWQERSGNKPNYASGGLVSTTYDPARVDEIVNGLRQEFAF